MNKNKPEWEKRFDKKFCMLKYDDGTSLGGGKAAYLAPRESLSIGEIKSYISSLLSKVIDEIELEGFFEQNEWTKGYNYALSKLDKIKKLKKKKYGIE